MRRARIGFHRTTICLGAVLAVAACSEISYTANRQPTIAKLESDLKVGVSTERDVIAALGQPSGRGRIFVPIAPEPREVLSYYFESGTVNVSHKSASTEQTMLYVWFAHGAYEGYMWMTPKIAGVMQ